MSLCKTAYELIPDLKITSDIIVGFPGETYEDFLQTVEVVREVKFSALFTFIFSPRIGTKAAKMDDPVPHSEKSKWFTELLRVQEEISANGTADMVGTTVRALCEEVKKNGIISARTSNNIVVEFEGDESLLNTFVDVEVTTARNFIVNGRLVK